MTEEEFLLEIQEIGYAAIESGDAELLGELIAPDFHATTADGKALGRDAWILAVTAAAAKGLRLRPGAATVTIAGDLAVVHRDVTVTAGDAEPAVSMSYVTVYERRDGRWVVVLNSTRTT